MLVPLSWLKEYVDIDVEAKELEEKLFSCGFEVEESYEVGKDISGVVVGLVEECEPIPETHLHVCKVNVGGAEPLQICCGADNVHAGGKYPVALEGAQVYATAKDHVTIEGTMKIKKGKLRGYETMTGYAVAEETAYEEEDMGRTVYMEERPAPRESTHRLLSEEGKLLATLEQPIYTIGKKRGETDLVLNDQSISRLHARIIKETDGYYLEDMNSTNGTFKNGLQLQPYERRKLEEGDEITLGKITVIYR